VDDDDAIRPGEIVAARVRSREAALEPANELVRPCVDDVDAGVGSVGQIVPAARCIDPADVERVNGLSGTATTARS